MQDVFRARGAPQCSSGQQQSHTDTVGQRRCMQGKSKQIWSVRCGRSSRRVGIPGSFDVGKRGGRLGTLEVKSVLAGCTNRGFSRASTKYNSSLAPELLQSFRRHLQSSLNPTSIKDCWPENHSGKKNCGVSTPPPDFLTVYHSSTFVGPLSEDTESESRSKATDRFES